MDKKMLTIGETATLIGVSIDTLRRWDLQGKLKPAFISPGKHRYYNKVDIDLFLNDIFLLAEKWASSNTPAAPSNDFYCRLKPVFQTRLEGFQDKLREMPEFKETYSLIVGAASEIGNNSFDHNLGNWPDIQGIFFGYDLARRKIALADRGRGVLTTLRAARPSIPNDAEALRVAFTEVLTGRTPENRGNGLKWVKAIITKQPMTLVFRSGNAEIYLQQDGAIQSKPANEPIPGCLALITY